MEYVYEIPAYIFNMLVDELDPSEWTIWDAFPRNGFGTDYMRSKGFEVTNGDGSSFLHTLQCPKPSEGRKLVLLMVPPFKTKQAYVKKLHELGIKHAAILVPTGTATTLFFDSYFPQDAFQMIVHQLHPRFLDRDTLKPVNNTSFTVMWATNRLNLSQDIIYKPRKDLSI